MPSDLTTVLLTSSFTSTGGRRRQLQAIWHAVRVYAVIIVVRLRQGGKDHKQIYRQHCRDEEASSCSPLLHVQFLTSDDELIHFFFYHNVRKSPGSLTCNMYGEAFDVMKLELYTYRDEFDLVLLTFRWGSRKTCPNSNELLVEDNAHQPTATPFVEYEQTTSTTHSYPQPQKPQHLSPAF